MVYFAWVGVMCVLLDGGVLCVNMVLMIRHIGYITMQAALYIDECRHKIKKISEYNLIARVFFVL